ncbi:FAD-binding and (Fe-S)-binding domain-containing protein [Streptomyces winkii]|uniref:FAD-binding and (Fe-S)-binding domain-containing protein n=1 Tax=Streptomyces winkii TaxID=3051178 RepID=UPI0028D4381F|nr:FAD-linked oxidase C-terminal domain-containing protein [Streptomyces sp. DSM 40971]
MTAISGDAPSAPATAASAREVEALLRGTVEGEVLFDDYTRHLFSRDASMYAIEPMGVVFPRHAGDVQAAVAAAVEAGIPVVPRGAGTSLAGQTVGPGLVLDLSRHMNRIVEIDTERRTALVETGVVQDQLNRAAAAHGLMFGPDTSTSNRATVGGMIGNNSAGSGSIRYGMTIDHVRELDVVLSDATRAHLAPLTEAERRRRAELPTLEGRLYRELPRIVRENAEAIAEGMPQFWRRACGYRLDRLAAAAAGVGAGPGVGAGAGAGGEFDLAKFVVGSEGTLVLATQALVDLVPKPARTVIAVGHFTSVAGAIAATEDALACDPAAVEMMDRTILDLSREKIEYASLSTILEGDPEALLFVSFTGDDERDLIGNLERLTALWRRHGHGYHTLQAVTPAQQGSLLKVRKSSLGLLMAASEGTRRPLAFIEDTAVDPLHLADYTRRFKQVLDRHGLNAGFYGHCSVGCLHIRPFVDTTDPAQVATMRTVAEEIKDLVREYGGVNSSEHGDGLARSEFNREIFGDDLYEAMRRVKGLFDPGDRLNPGKIVDAPAMTDNLRDPALPPAGPLRTRLDFEVVGGMRGAADRCMNIGLCRKADAGTMCPSYMATLKEEDSTRGRANALVKALSEPDPHRALGDGRLHEVLDLCLMCKACKSECPLGVDMATLKAESLAHHHDEHGVPRRSRVFASIRSLNRLGSAAAPLSNLPGRVPFLRALLDRWLGITPSRPLPVFVRGNLVRWFRRRERARTSAPGSAPPGPQGTVTYLADSFTTYTEPGIGRAAVELLERAGWHVALESRGCCGRSAFSKGLLDEAKDQARRLTRLLSETAPAGSPVVGCEPSCLMTLRDEHRAMLPRDEAVADVSGRVRQVEELLTEAIDDGRLSLAPEAWPAGKRILYHGHCHQKAEVGTAATVALLKRIPGAEVVELDAGCCGMAGSFGFESEHYETSMTVGNDRLFPAIAAEDERTVVAASGVSCRQQIFHGTERTAWHPVELVRAALLTAAGATGQAPGAARPEGGTQQ